MIPSAFFLFADVKRRGFGPAQGLQESVREILSGDPIIDFEERI
jgi:hypothetical protein